MKVFKIRPDAKLPTKADGDMCYDLYASFEANDPDVKLDYEGRPYINIDAVSVAKIPTGIKLALPQGYHCSIRGRSGLAAKNGMMILGGQIDNTYRGEIIVLCTIVYGFLVHRVYNGDKIAQFKLEKDETFEIEQVFSEAELGETSRGGKGFGSSGS